MKDPIIQAGSVLLRQKAKPFLKKEFGSAPLKKLILNMSRALSREEFGVALAGPQIGESKRIFVIAGRAFVVGSEEEDEQEQKPIPPDMVFINPEIIRLSRKKREMSEGCLSVRGMYGKVLRHERASVKAQDMLGNTFTYHGTGLIAHIFQHECDHLDGILYTDKATALREEKQAEKKEVKK